MHPTYESVRASLLKATKQASSKQASEQPHGGIIRSEEQCPFGKRPSHKADCSYYFDKAIAITCESFARISVFCREGQRE
ncbi:hypothetical protein HZH68_010722 [Vespula germanica]|uniref:Uncharacterized protein n=1 Tax=Vespula germanica TaxID=30212 RepID=A0A834N4D7_VESGE|nr:hypothetical protein HZH68_010722 [Vespula germanica]